MSAEELEQLRYEKQKAERHLEDAHQRLDTLGVPREWPKGQIMTLAGRLEWLSNYVPVSWGAVTDALVVFWLKHADADDIDGASARAWYTDQLALMQTKVEQNS